MIICPVPFLSLSDILLFSSENYSPWSFKEQLKPYQSVESFMSGAEALAFVCKKEQIGKQRPVTLLLPAYFCGQSLRYLRNQNVKFVFYPLTKKLDPNYRYLKRLLKVEKIDLFLHVHYFGRISKQTESRRLSDRAKMVMIEDCAHLIGPEVNNKWVGDYLIFSPHKYFPVPTIGILLSKKKQQNRNARPRAFFSYKWLIWQLIRRYLYQGKRQVVYQLLWSEMKATASFYRPSMQAERLLNGLYKTQQWVGDIRRRNASALLGVLLKKNGWEVVSDFAINEVPYIVGMWCDSVERARHRYQLLNQHKQLVMLWPDLPKEIKFSPELAFSVIFLTRRSLFFPVHQYLVRQKWIDELQKVIGKNEF